MSTDPLHFIMYDATTDKFCLNHESVATLRLQVPRGVPLNIISIAGNARTGKSFILNRLFGSNRGFNLGHSIESCTQGIWIWYKAITIKSQVRHVLLLDTEGLAYFDRDSRFDKAIMSLALLLCSLFVFNGTNTIDRKMIEQLQFVIGLVGFIKLRSGNHEEAGDQFHTVFPPLLWVVRDFYLNLKDAQGNQLTENEYLEKALVCEGGFGDDAARRNNLRRAILSFFQRRECICCPKPVEDDEMLQKVQDLPYEALKPRFREKMEQIVSYIWEASQPKRMFNQAWDIEILLAMASRFVDAINNGAIIPVEDSWEQAKSAANERLVSEIVIWYEAQLRKALQPLPVDQEALFQAHTAHFETALQMFNERIVDDTGNVYRISLQNEVASFSAETATLVGGKLKQLSDENFAASTARCQDVIQQLFNQNILPKLRNKHYFPPQGRPDDYLNDMQNLQTTFNSVNQKGPAAATVFEQFMESKKEVFENLVSTNTALTERDRKLLEEKQERARVDAEMAKRNQEVETLQRQMSSFQETAAQQMQSLKDEQERQHKEREAAHQQELENMRKTAADLQEKNFKEYAKLLENQAANEKKAWAEQQEKDLEQRTQLAKTIQALQTQVEAMKNAPPVVIRERRSGGFLGRILDKACVVM